MHLKAECTYPCPENDIQTRDTEILLLVVDGILIYSRTFEEHSEHLTHVLDKLGSPSA
jgi:hypothetical protein